MTGFNRLRIVSLMLLLSVFSLLVYVPVEAAPSPTVNDKQFRYVASTGHGIIGPILRLYNRTGGEERHGKPVSEPVRYKNHYIQYFERSLIEFYPQYVGTEAETRLSPLGQMASTDAHLNFPTIAAFTGNLDNWYFPETGHSLSAPFLEYWRNMPLLGNPLSEPLDEIGPNGTTTKVQYFENARLQRPATGEITMANLGTIRARQQLKPAQLAALPVAHFQETRNVRIPSLMFHYARLVDEKKDPLGYGLSVTPDNYVKFLDWTQANGYNTVTVEQVLDYMKYGIALPEKPVIFRWDDGHDNNWFVYQEMKKRGMTATFYVITQRLELTPAQWKQIDSDGFEVAAHTRNHLDLRGVQDLTKEITGSKQDLERLLGHPVRDFAYPYGGFNDKVMSVVKQSGFEIAVSTQGGYGWKPDTMFEQPVLSVTGRDDLHSFAAKIAGASGEPVTVADDQEAAVSKPVPTPTHQAQPKNKAQPTPTPRKR